MEETIAAGEESIRNSIDEGDHKMAAGGETSDTEGKKDIPSDESTVPGKISHQEFWAMFTGMKLKEYSASELEAFKKPFRMGWRREVVLRGTVTNSGKKIGDVYYFSPCKKIKLRSYVEMGLFLRKQGAKWDLEPENFTFARQPIYEPPLEIVRHAMTRGSNQVSDAHIIHPPADVVVSSASTAAVESVVKPIETPSSSVSSTPVTEKRSTTRSLSTTSSVDEPEIFTGGIAEGRAKRKRVAPTRFEDEDYNEASPFKRNKSIDKSKGSIGQSPLAATSSKDAKATPVSGGKTGVVIRLNRKTTTPSTTPTAGVDSKSIVSSPVKGPSSSVDTTVKKETSNQKPQQLVKPSINTIQVTNPKVVAATDMKAKAPSEPSQAAVKLDQRMSTNGANKTPDSEGLSLTKKATNFVGSSMNGEVKQQNQAMNSMMKSFKIIKPKPSSESPALRPPPLPSSSLPLDESFGEEEDGGLFGDDGKTMVPPCSIVCGGGQVPSLLCFRCLCLFHTSCVPNGLYLANQQFVCPNCVQPNDQGKKVLDSSSSSSARVNGEDMSDRQHYQQQKQTPQHQFDSKEMLSRQQTSSQRTPSLLQTQLTKKFVPILPKPSQSSQVVASVSTPMMRERQKSHLELLQLFQQQTRGNFLASHHKEEMIAKQKMRPVINTGTNGQVPSRKPVPSQPRKMYDFVMKSGQHTLMRPMFGRPGVKSNSSGQSSRLMFPSSSIPSSGLLSREKHQQMSKMIHSQLQSLPGYQPAPIAPIAPIKVTPAQVKSILDKMSGSKYREYLDKKWSPMTSLLSSFDTLSYCLQFLSPEDLKNLRCVNRSFERLVSQSEPWNRLKQQEEFCEETQ